MKVLAAPSSPSRSKRTTSEEAELLIKEDPLQQSRGKSVLLLQPAFSLRRRIRQKVG